MKHIKSEERARQTQENSQCVGRGGGYVLGDSGRRDKVLLYKNHDCVLKALQE